MDFRKVKKGMIVGYYNFRKEWEYGIIHRVYNENGQKVFQVIWTDREVHSWSTESKNSSRNFDFKTGEFIQDFDKLLK